VDRRPALGSLDSAVQERPVQISRVTVPPGTTLPSFDLATFSAGSRSIGRSNLVLMDSLVSAGTPRLFVQARTLARIGPDLRVRVGSCVTWHGFHGRTLYLLQRGGRPVDRIRLSGVS
jgi:hypothetical protein